jgi:NTE family protein
VTVYRQARDAPLVQHTLIEPSSVSHEFRAAAQRIPAGHTRRSLKRQDWLAMPPPGAGVVVHDVHRETD